MTKNNTEKILTKYIADINSHTISHYLAHGGYNTLKKALSITPDDLVVIERLCENMAGQTICSFAEAVTGPALPAVRKFKLEFEDHIRDRRCSHKANRNRTMVDLLSEETYV